MRTLVEMRHAMNKPYYLKISNSTIEDAPAFYTNKVVLQVGACATKVFTLIRRAPLRFLKVNCQSRIMYFHLKNHLPDSSVFLKIVRLFRRIFHRLLF